MYLDTGVFYDYLIYRSMMGGVVRTRGRRNRSINQLSQDVEDCLKSFRRNAHDVFTSSITFLEVEESIYERLRRTLPSVDDRHKYLIMSSRPNILQVITICNQYNIDIINFSIDLARKSVENCQLQSLGIRARDTIHLVSAIDVNADLVISTDRHLLNLNRQITNANGNPIQCLDTNDAKNIL